MANSVRRIVLDMDVGIDDAIAIAYLAGRPDAEIVALGSVHGNCTTVNATANALRVLEVCGLDRVPVAHGAVQPMAQPLEIASYVHGEDGLGDATLAPPQGSASGEHAVDQLIRLSSEHPGELDLLAVGPLTNLGLAVERDPEVLLRFRSVVIMGGSGPFPEPGVILLEDPNVYHDRRAAELVFAAERERMVMVGVNVTTPAILDEADVLRLAESEEPQAKLLTAALPFYLTFAEQFWGRRVSSMHDPLAAAILLDPTLMTEELMGPVNVRGEGVRTRAMLMRLPDGTEPKLPITPAPSTVVATGVDQERFADDLMKALLAPLAGRVPEAR